MAVILFFTFNIFFISINISSLPLTWATRPFHPSTATHTVAPAAKKFTHVPDMTGIFPGILFFTATTSKKKNVIVRSVALIQTFLSTPARLRPDLFTWNLAV